MADAESHGPTPDFVRKLYAEGFDAGEVDAITYAYPLIRSQLCQELATVLKRADSGHGDYGKGWHEAAEFVESFGKGER